ncbi:MFS transporter [Oceanibaculum indicum]|uniref:Major facilitator superfamily protein n=1 Tax=Oceanibaculum indicum P24 TaxID=1207063 RepID=K2JNR5_9PROT|nr:MFS transporter [Oceanibaculum indicum]EKE72104.1 major facilitator superfamily protein [Oceanibaculum indicum P24]
MADMVSDTEQDTETFVSWREFLGSPYAASLALVCLAVWLHAADSLIVATMLPAIVAEIGGIALVGWSVSLYEIGSIVAGAASALLTLRFGLRAPMSMAAALFGFGCILSAVSPTMPLLLTGRALQGLGGGGLMAMGFVAVGQVFPRRYIARAMAAVSILWGVSAFAGPLVGGFFVEYATWRWGFAFFAGQAFALALWIVLRHDADATRPATDATEFPARRLSLLCLAVVLVAFGGVEVSILRTVPSVTAGLVCLIGFLWLDRRAGDTRLFPRRPFDLWRPVGASLLMILTMSMATIPITAFGPLLVTVIHGVSALTAGYIVACSSIGWAVMAVLVSGLPERFDRLMIALGMAIVALSLLGFLYAVPGGPVWLIVVFAAMEGGGFGMAWTFILRRTIALADADEVQRVSGAIPTIQRLGYAFGAAYVGIVANASGLLSMETTADAAKVARWTFVSCVPFAVIGLIALGALVRDRKGEMRQWRQ